MATKKSAKKNAKKIGSRPAVSPGNPARTTRTTTAVARNAPARTKKVQSKGGSSQTTNGGPAPAAAKAHPRNKALAADPRSPKKPAEDAPKSSRPRAPSSKPNGMKASTSNRKPTWQLRLYVAGDSPRSRVALSNLRKLCEDRLKGDYEIEVIDLTKMPHLAKADQILAVPTLVRSIPEPMKRIIGDLSNSDRALVALDLDTFGVKTP